MGIPEKPCLDLAATTSPTQLSGLRTNGSRMNPCSNFFTFLTSLAWNSTEQLWWMIPIPPFSWRNKLFYCEIVVNKWVMYLTNLLIHGWKPLTEYKHVFRTWPGPTDLSFCLSVCLSVCLCHENWIWQAYPILGIQVAGVTKTKTLENEDLRPKTRSSFSYYQNEDPSLSCKLIWCWNSWGFPRVN